ncbi:MAG: acyl-CoA dehydrogenase family protein [Acidimicrobiales bacterium]
MAGALGQAVELSVQYCNEREQFGRAIGKFQVLQQYLAHMAGEAAAAEAAADNAVDVVAGGASDAEAVAVIAAAKTVTGRAVGIINRLAHQIHGAIGYTDEHRLQYSTRRLWAWRDEHGAEAEWAATLGRALAAAGGAALWPNTITAWPPAAR